MSNDLVSIYLDDERQTPPGFLRTYTAPETIQALKANEGNVHRLSLDHDLGETFAPGYDVLLWLEEAVICRGFIPPRLINIHSANAGAAPKMKAAARNILNWYREREPTMITDEEILNLLEAKFPEGDVRGSIRDCCFTAEIHDAPGFAMVITLDHYPSDANYLNDIVAAYDGAGSVLFRAEDRNTLTLAALTALVDKAIVGSKFLLTLENAK